MKLVYYFVDFIAFYTRKYMIKLLLHSVFDPIVQTQADTDYSGWDQGWDQKHCVIIYMSPFIYVSIYLLVRYGPKYVVNRFSFESIKYFGVFRIRNWWEVHCIGLC